MSKLWKHFQDTRSIERLTVYYYHCHLQQGVKGILHVSRDFYADKERGFTRDIFFRRRHERGLFSRKTAVCVPLISAIVP